MNKREMRRAHIMNEREMRRVYKGLMRKYRWERIKDVLFWPAIIAMALGYIALLAFLFWQVFNL